MTHYINGEPVTDDDEVQDITGGAGIVITGSTGPIHLGRGHIIIGRGARDQDDAAGTGGDDRGGTGTRRPRRR